MLGQEPHSPAFQDELFGYGNDFHRQLQDARSAFSFSYSPNGSRLATPSGSRASSPPPPLSPVAAMMDVVAPVPAVDSSVPVSLCDKNQIRSILSRHGDRPFARLWLQKRHLFPDTDEMDQIATMYAAKLEGLQTSDIQPSSLMTVTERKQCVTSESQWVGLARLLERTVQDLVIQKTSWAFLLDFCQRHPDVLGCVPIHIEFIHDRIALLEEVMKVLEQWDGTVPLHSYASSIGSKFYDTVLCSTAEPPQLPPSSSSALPSTYYSEHLYRACSEWWIFLQQHRATLFPLPDETTPFSFSAAMAHFPPLKTVNLVTLEQERTAGLPFLLMMKLLTEWIIPHRHLTGL